MTSYGLCLMVVMPVRRAWQRELPRPGHGGQWSLYLDLLDHSFWRRPIKMSRRHSVLWRGPYGDEMRPPTKGQHNLSAIWVSQLESRFSSLSWVFSSLQPLSLSEWTSLETLSWNGLTKWAQKSWSTETINKFYYCFSTSCTYCNLSRYAGSCILN